MKAYIYIFCCLTIYFEGQAQNPKLNKEITELYKRVNYLFGGVFIDTTFKSVTL